MRHRSLPPIAISVLLWTAPGLHAEDKFLDSNGVRLYFTDEGQGEPVALTHGFADSEQAFIDELAESLESGKGIAPLIRRLTPEGRPKPTEQELQNTNQFLMALNDSKALAAVIRGIKELRVQDEPLKNNQVPVLAL